MLRDFPDFVTIDSETLLTEVLAMVEERTGPLPAGDERRIFTEAITYVINVVLAMVNDAARQRLPQFARSVVLDYYGEAWGVTRHSPTPAWCEVTLTRQTPTGGLLPEVTVPPGLKVGDQAGTLVFTTIDSAVFAENQVETNVIAVSAQVGEKATGLPPGLLCVPIDVYPPVSGIVSATPTTGGSDGEPYTAVGDDAYRERIAAATHSPSTAGSTLGYEFWARLADPSITDVAATNAAPGVVQVVVVTGGGGSGPTPQGILDLVEAKLSPDDVRPLGDQVIVIGPTTVPCAVDVTYHVPAASAGDVQRAVEEPGGAIDDYYDWQCGTLGRGINPDQLRKRILQAGATRVTVTSPSDTPLAGSEIAVRDTTVANVVISED